MKAALYLRVSTVGQVGRAFSEEGYSIETQRERCHRKAQELEADVVDEYIDYGDSARYANRSQFQALLRRAREQRDLDYVVVYNVSRFARKMEDDVVIATDLERLGVGSSPPQSISTTRRSASSCDGYSVLRPSSTRRTCL